MSRRKERSAGLRLLSAVASFVFLGAGIYMFFAGVNLYNSALMTSAVLGLGIPAVVAGDGFLEMVVGFFEVFFDGLMEVVGGVLEALSSIFN
ncbi:hypothetical protein OS175_00160 [Marinicella sp. S1101]|uniref:hypothetical protein n=1 Tax=Marinicella marina TaxID=2996016 RepID=UPI002260BBBC|nr:hypothetical protein [Marinicella marina]MCX7552274.1 hypothetical protein [Marinicella marina]MDJ1139150.1 hypothetical protein [Marinicella marina]